MEKKKISLIGSLATLFFLLASHICLGGDYEIINDNFPIATTSRHEMIPDSAYNPVNNDFMILWHTNGPFGECDGPNMWSIDGQRVSPNGERLGDTFSLEGPTVDTPNIYAKLSHNMFTNQYLATYTKQHGETGDDVFIALIGSDGVLGNGFPRCLSATPTRASHPDPVFNSRDREYLVIYNDSRYKSENPSFEVDSIVARLDEDGELIGEGEFWVGSQEGIQYNPQIVYNPMDNNYLTAWEDYRGKNEWTDQTDIWGALLDESGKTVKEIPLWVDKNEDDDDQRTQEIAYNSHRNEYLVITDETRADGNVPLMGRVFEADGTPIGKEDFVVADAAGEQTYPHIVYVETRKKYFAVWFDTRNASSGAGDSWRTADTIDIFGRWLSESGEPIGDEIEICVREGRQLWERVAYNPVMDQLLITWQDENVYECALTDDVLWFSGGDIRGTIYGVPSFLYGQVIEEGTGNPVEGAWALVMGPSLPAMKKTNVGGWFNVAKESQPNGKYLAVVFKLGYFPTIQAVDYAGEPRIETIELKKLW